jgi:ribosomal protein L40E
MSRPFPADSIDMPDAVDLVRCPDCGAANPAGAGWCGQCLRRFGAAGPSDAEPMIARAEPSIVTAPQRRSAGPLVQVREGEEPVWTCPACEAVNPLSAATCARCGSEFTSFFPTEPVARPARVSTNAAIGLSAALPGIGHWAFHDAPAAVARGLLYLWSLGIAVMLLARPPAAARALVRGVGACFALSAAAIWLLSMLETLRLAGGNRRPIVPPKSLTWFTAGLSVLLFFGLLAAVFAAR